MDQTVAEDLAPEERIKHLEERVALLESQAHTSHTIEPDVLDQIAAHAVSRLNDHLRQSLGARPPIE